MIQVYVNRIGWIVGLTLLQVLILNNVSILGFATPFLYIYFILKLGSNISRNELMLWSFFLGLLIDIFSDTPGMNAAASVFAAFVRPAILRAFTPRDNFDAFIPSFRTIGLSAFFKYISVMVLLHHTFLLTVESFSLHAIHILLLKIISSTLLTILCISALEGIRK